MGHFSGEEFLSQSRLHLGEYGVSKSEYSFEPAMGLLPNIMWVHASRPVSRIYIN